MFSSKKRLLYLAAFVILLVAVLNIIWWLNYQRTEQMMDNQLGRRLEAVAKSASAALDPGKVAQLNFDNEAYFEIISFLEKIRNADSLSEVFIINQNYEILATTALEADSIYFLAELNGRYIDSIFLSYEAISTVTPSYKTGRIFLKSAFAPVYDSDGLTIALVGTEANVDYFEALYDLKKNLLYSTVFSIIGGIIIGLIFIFFQRKINAAEQKLYLNETHAYLGRMVAVVSHEIKNPLMIIRASAERLVKKTELEEAKFVIEEVDRLNEIVTGYLDFAGQKENFVENEEIQTIDLNELLENIKSHFSTKYPEHKIEWLDVENGEKISIATYPRSLRQVILNLLINGADACLGCGKPIVLGLCASQNQKTVNICITDKGSGLKKAEIKKMFEPFYTTKTSGSGLGLYLSRKIVESMGGELEINSVINEKTELIINLPIK